MFAGFPTSTPYSWLLLNAPPIMIRRDPAFPLMNTPEPSLLIKPAGAMAVPLPLAVTLLRVTTLALLIVIPSPSFAVAITFVSVTIGALRVAPSDESSVISPLPLLGFLFSLKLVLLIVMEPLFVVAEKPALFELFPS